jgi:hypothetical protein
MKIFRNFVLVCALTLGAVATMDPTDNYIEDAEYAANSGEDSLGEFTPRFLDQNDPTSAGLGADTTFDPAITSALDSISSPIDVTSVGELPSIPIDAENGLVNIDSNSDTEHNRNYVKISSDLKTYEDAYKACIDNLSDNDFSQEDIEKCVGVDYQFVYDDIDFEKRKILSRADNAVRTAMIVICYNAAGPDLVMDNACDLIQRDALELMWTELNFEIIIEYHREKYVFIHSKLPESLFSEVINRFKDIYSELSQLIEELYSHRDLTIMRIKKDIDERTALINDKFKFEDGHPTPKIKQDVITINEMLLDAPIQHSNINSLSNLGFGNNDFGPAYSPFDQLFNGENDNSEFDDPNYDSHIQFSDSFKKRHLSKTPNSNISKRQRSIPANRLNGQNRAITMSNTTMRNRQGLQNKIQINGPRVGIKRNFNFRRMRLPQAIRRANSRIHL